MKVSQEIVDSLNIQQASGRFHPYTCCGGIEPSLNCKRRISYDARDNGEKIEYTAENEGVLIATEDGWICPCGDYKQEYRQEIK